MRHHDFQKVNGATPGDGADHGVIPQQHDRSCEEETEKKGHNEQTHDDTDNCEDFIHSFVCVDVF